MFSILVADDEASMTEFLDIMLTREGYEVTTVPSAEEAMAALDRGAFDLVISDINMPLAGGMAVLRHALERDGELPVVMVTAYASTDTAVEAMKLGAYDYVTKPFKNDEIRLIVAKALERRSDRAQLKTLRSEAAGQAHRLGDLLGRSIPMQELFRMIRKVADSRSTVLITGESGCGKELVARAIHHLSARAEGPFHSVNCGALPEQLLESELFGHQKGAFTSAHADKKGLLELCDGGTFFLDEVGEAPLSVQIKMLRVLQEREFKRVGGARDIRVDIRVIAATNQNLEELIADGAFREDFYYRLNIIHLHIPPLRERREDIPLLVSRFIEKYAAENRREVTAISTEAMRMLERHPWRGNVRELENVIERAVVLASGSRIEAEHLPDELAPPASGDAAAAVPLPEKGLDLEQYLESLEKEMLLKALDNAGGVKTRAASLLNLSFRSFRYKLQKYGLEGDKEGTHA